MERAVVVHYKESDEIKVYSSVQGFIDDHPTFKRGTLDNHISRDNKPYTKDNIRVMRLPVIQFTRRKRAKAVGSRPGTAPKRLTLKKQD